MEWRRQIYKNKEAIFIRLSYPKNYSKSINSQSLKKPKIKQMIHRLIEKSKNKKIKKRQEKEQEKRR